MASGWNQNTSASNSKASSAGRACQKRGAEERGIAASGIGKRNADFACEWLAREGIELVASDFLGACSRKVLFVPATGDAYCRRMTTTMASVQEVAKAEQAYAETLKRPPPKSNPKPPLME